MIYIVKNQSGAEFQVDEDQYNYLKKKDEYTCRILDSSEPLQPILKAEKWPKKDENSSWYTLSNGKRVQGEEKANKAQSEIDG